MSIVLDDNTVANNAVESLSPTLTHRWLCDGWISNFKLESSSREDGMKWAEKTKQNILKWPKERPYLALLDLSSPGMTLTPSFKQLSAEVQTMRPELEGLVALILTKGFVAQLIRLMLRSRPNAIRRTEIFFSYDEGLNWLKAQIPAAQAVSQR